LGFGLLHGGFLRAFGAFFQVEVSRVECDGSAVFAQRIPIRRPILERLTDAHECSARLAPKYHADPVQKAVLKQSGMIAATFSNAIRHDPNPRSGVSVGLLKVNTLGKGRSPDKCDADFRKMWRKAARTARTPFMTYPLQERKFFARRKARKEIIVVSILVIDDDTQMRTFLRKLLEAQGYEVREAKDGREGINAYRQRPAEIVLCDIFMSEKEGLQTIRELHDEFGRVRVVAMSGGNHYLGHVAVLDLAKKCGAVGALLKPFEKSTLVDTLNKVLAGEGNEGPQGKSVPRCDATSDDVPPAKARLSAEKAW
jgi:CheY-like chemotaxis protein